MLIRGTIIASVAYYNKDVTCLLCQSCKHLKISQTPKSSDLVVMAMLLCNHPDQVEDEISIIDPLVMPANEAALGLGMTLIVTSCTGYEPALGGHYAPRDRTAHAGLYIGNA